MSDRTDLYPGTWAERTLDAPAVVISASGEIVTYAELDALANRLSRRFHAAGLKPGDHMAFCLENWPEYLRIIWGAPHAGLREAPHMLSRQTLLQVPRTSRTLDLRMRDIPSREGRQAVAPRLREPGGTHTALDRSK